MKTKPNFKEFWKSNARMKDTKASGAGPHESVKKKIKDREHKKWKSGVKRGEYDA